MESTLRSVIFIFALLFMGETDSQYNPPRFWLKAQRARYAIHHSNWAVIGTISTHSKTAGQVPFTNVISFSDGPLSNSTGIPYFYVMNGDTSVQDLKKNPALSLTISEMEKGYCQANKYDPEDPRCARVTLTGRFVKVTSKEEEKFAKNALFSRHPEMKTWSKVHNFFVAKMEIEMVWIVDYFGGATYITPTDYFAAAPEIK